MNRRDFMKAAAGLAALPFAAKAASTPASTKVVLTADTHIFSTGLPTLDHALGGGLRTGCIGLVIGNTGSGKTALLRTVFRHNLPLISESRGISLDMDGHNDVLHLWPGRPDLNLPEDGGCLVTDIAPIKVDEEYIRSTRSLCQSSNMACLVTMPAKQRPHNKYDLLVDDVDAYEMWHECMDSFAMMRICDYVLTLHGSRIFVVKSRYEPKGAVKIIRFTPNGHGGLQEERSWA